MFDLRSAARCARSRAWRFAAVKGADGVVVNEARDDEAEDASDRLDNSSRLVAGPPLIAVFSWWNGEVNQLGLGNSSLSARLIS